VARLRACLKYLIMRQKNIHVQPQIIPHYLITYIRLARTVYIRAVYARMFDSKFPAKSIVNTPYIHGFWPTLQISTSRVHTHTHTNTHTHIHTHRITPRITTSQVPISVLEFQAQIVDQTAWVSVQVGAICHTVLV
jgi:hypothetical protein